MEVSQLYVGGMACAFCASTIEKGLTHVEGVKSAKVFMESGEVIIKHDPSVVDKPRLKRELQRLGYYAFDGKANMSEVILADSRKRALRTWVFAAASLLLALPLMFPNALASLSASIPSYYGLLAASTNFVIATVVLFHYAMPIHRGTVEALKKHILNEHVLYGVAGFGAYALGILGFLIPSLRPFFFIAVLLTGLHLSAGWLGALLRTDVEKSVTKLMENRPLMARLVREDQKETEVPISEVHLGDVMMVKPGERIPLDGVVVDGASEVSEAFLTGESTPVAKKTGDKVLGGSTNGSGTLTIMATSDFRGSYISRILDLVRTAKQTRSTILTFFDRVVDHVWVPLVLVIAAITFVTWAIVGAIAANPTFWEGGIVSALLVVVIGYPCAIGFSSPSVGLSVFSEFANNGILVKDTSVFERLKDVNTVIFDKTGTLTYGRPQVVQVVTSPGVDEESLVRTAASLESESSHPISRSIVEVADARTTSMINVKGFKEVGGAGVTGFVDGKRVAIGKPEFLLSLGFDRREVCDILQSFPEAAKSPIVVGSENRVMGAFDVIDSVRPDARSVVSRLKEMRLRLLMVTGDTEAVASTVSDQVGGIEFFAKKAPEEKVRIVQECKEDKAEQEGKRRGKVLMVGDGLNDAAALSTADVGIATAASIDVSKDVADVVLVSSKSLGGVVALLENSKFASRASSGNVLLALAFNAAGIPLAMFGILSASEAMLIMALSLCGVFLNAYATKFRLKGRLTFLKESKYRL
ncbi:MAG: cation-translocating P-type ATPase [Thermoprotei archaeon]